MPSANKEFLAECFAFDELAKQIAELRDDHFGADPEVSRNWGDVGSVRYANEKLREILIHFNR